MWDGLHLRSVRDGIAAALRRLPARSTVALDVWCGAKPYEALLGGTVIGLDIDRHFGAADVVTATPLAVRDRAVELALCSQALHIVPRDVGDATIAELWRVVAPGGHVVVTVPCTMLRVGPAAIEGRHSPTELARRFAGWEDVRVDVAGGLGTATAHGAGLVADAVRRRLGLAPAWIAPVALAANLLGRALDALPGIGRRFPHTLVLTARRPHDPGAGARGRRSRR